MNEIADVPAITDPLAEALHFLRMDGMFYCHSELTAPWGIDMPQLPGHLWFHVVTAGDCILVDSSGQDHELRQGDVVVLPHGSRHWAKDRPDVDTPSVFDLPHDYVSRQYAVLRHGGGGRPATIVCGVVRFGHPAGQTLIELLPEIIRIEGRIAGAEWPWLPTLLGLMAAETQHPRPGGEAVVTRICDILVIQAIRNWIDTSSDAQSGWLGALRDPAIGGAIARIHREPERDWTVASLADEVAMSRSAFSARFTDLVGQPAMQYVARWRMLLAVDLLRDEQFSIAQIAARLGYGSEAAFSRAFKRIMGEPPSAARESRSAMDPEEILATYGSTPAEPHLVTSASSSYSSLR